MAFCEAIVDTYSVDHASSDKAVHTVLLSLNKRSSQIIGCLIGVFPYRGILKMFLLSAVNLLCQNCQR